LTSYSWRSTRSFKSRTSIFLNTIVLKLPASNPITHDWTTG